MWTPWTAQDNSEYNNIQGETASSLSESGIMATMYSYMPSFGFSSSSEEPQAIVEASYDDQTQSWVGSIGSAISTGFSYAFNAYMFKLRHWHEVTYAGNVIQFMGHSHKELQADSLQQTLLQESQIANPKKRVTTQALISFVARANQMRKAIRTQFKDNCNIENGLELIESISLGHVKLIDLDLNQSKCLIDIYNATDTFTNRHNMKLSTSQFVALSVKIQMITAYNITNINELRAISTSTNLFIHSFRHYYNGESGRAKEAIYNGIKESLFMFGTTGAIAMAALSPEWSMAAMVAGTYALNKIRSRSKFNLKNIFLGKRQRMIAEFYSALMTGDTKRVKELEASLKEKYGVDPFNIDLLAEIENVSRDLIREQLIQFIRAGLVGVLLHKEISKDRAVALGAEDKEAYLTSLLSKCTTDAQPTLDNLLEAQYGLFNKPFKDFVEKFVGKRYKPLEQHAQLLEDLNKLQASNSDLFEYALLQIEKRVQNTHIRAITALADALSKPTIENSKAIFANIQTLKGSPYEAFFRQEFAQKLIDLGVDKSHRATNRAITPMANSQPAKPYTATTVSSNSSTVVSLPQPN